MQSPGGTAFSVLRCRDFDFLLQIDVVSMESNDSNEILFRFSKQMFPQKIQPCCGVSPSSSIIVQMRTSCSIYHKKVRPSSTCLSTCRYNTTGQYFHIEETLGRSRRPRKIRLGPQNRAEWQQKPSTWLPSGLNSQLYPRSKYTWTMPVAHKYSKASSTP